MATERLAPDTVAASTNLTGTGTIATIQEDPDSADVNWFTATSVTAATDLRVTFPTPTGVPAGAQDFKLWLRKTTGATTPVVDVQLYQGGSLRATLLTATSITSTTGQLLTASWNSSDLTGTLDGSDVEVRVVSTVGATADTVGAMPAYGSQPAAMPGAASSAQAPVVASIAPAIVNAGDLLLYTVGTRDDTYTTTCSTPSGFTAFSGNPFGTLTTTTYIPRIWLFWKIADGTEDGATINVTTSLHSTSSTARGTYTCIYRFTAANGFDATPVTTASIAEGLCSGFGTNIGCPTVVASGTNKLAVMVAAANDNTGATGDHSPTGESGGNWVEIGGYYESGTGGDWTMSWHNADMSAGGTISGGAAIYGDGGDYGLSVGFCLVPASTPGAAVNTVEIGAIEWNVTYTAGAGTAVPALMAHYRRRRV